MNKSKISIFIAACLLLISMSCSRSSDVNHIIWSGTKEYDEKLLVLKIQPANARKILEEKTGDHAGFAFSGEPVFICHDEYFFSVPSKVDVSLEGVYIHGLTGSYEYRRSNKKIKMGQSTLPDDAYFHVRNSGAEK